MESFWALLRTLWIRYHQDSQLRVRPWHYLHNISFLRPCPVLVLRFLCSLECS